MSKTALYVRVSTIGQVDNYSIEMQKEKLEAFCVSRGWVDIEVYEDAGYTGSNVDRPEK